MRYTLIPGTDLNPSVICMGGGPISVENYDDRIFAILDTYYDLGGTFIDSANIYGKWLPSGENVSDINIGKWLKTRGLRNKIIVTSKGGHPPLSDMTKPRLLKAEVEADIDESLIALRSDYIDLYYLHRDDENIPVEYIIEYLNDFVKDGKIRYFASSNWKADRIKEAQNYAVKSGKQGFSANQLMWSLAVPDMTKMKIPLLVSMDSGSKLYHLESGLAAIAYESQARGFFQKYAYKDLVPLAGELEAVYCIEENFMRFDRVIKLSRELDIKITAVTLGYILNQAFTSIAIIGSHTIAQLKDSMAAADTMLTPEQVKYLEDGKI